MERFASWTTGCKNGWPDAHRVILSLGGQQQQGASFHPEPVEMSGVGARGVDPVEMKSLAWVCRHTSQRGRRPHADIPRVENSNAPALAVACGAARSPARGEWVGLSLEIGVSPEALYRELARRRLRDGQRD